VSRVNALIRQSQEMTALTVRVPESVMSFISELVDIHNTSRQDVVLALIEDGIDYTRRGWEERQQPAADTNARYHILNTNKAHTDEDQEMMLSEGIAAAFYDPWYDNIDRIKEGDWVFLYENRKGIIAFGRGTGKTVTRDHEGHKDACKYQKLSDFTILKTPLSAKEVKTILGRNVVFLRTMAGVPDGQALLDRARADS
jgi:hypothetical protein